MARLKDLVDELHLKIALDERMSGTIIRTILAWESDNPDTYTSQTEIARRTRMTPETISRCFSKLIEFGYLEKFLDVNNEVNYRYTKALIDELTVFGIKRKAFNKKKYLSEKEQQKDFILYYNLQTKTLN